LKLLFAWRYFRSEKSVNAINIISWISVLAIAVVVAALIIVFSVFNGFEDLVKSLYADFYSDVRLIPASGKILKLDANQISQLKHVNGVIAISFVTEEKAVLVNGESQGIVTVKGVDSAQSLVTNLSHHLLRGKFSMGSVEKPEIVMGVGIEGAVGADVERSIYPLTLYMPNRNETEHLGSIDGMNSFQVNASGTFMVQEEFDNKYIFTNIDFVKYMLDMKPNEYSFCEVKLDSNLNQEKIINNIQQLLGNKYKLKTRYQQNQSLYSAMQIEKWVIYGVTCLILMVAAFNIIGALTMLVLEKQKDIAVLSAMGANDGTIQQIFLLEGILLSIVGGGIGIAIATTICFLQVKFHLIALSGGSFLINYYPVKMMLSDFVIVFLTVFIIAIGASWFPARKAGKEKLELKS